MESFTETGKSGGSRRELFASAWMTWLVSILITLIATIAVLIAVGSIFGEPVSGGTDTRLGVFAICVGLATFLGFTVAPMLRRASVPDRSVRSATMVAGIHIVVTGSIFLVDLVARLVTGADAPPIFDGTVAEEIGRGLAILAPSWIGAVAGCLTSLGLVDDHTSSVRRFVP